MGDSKGNLAVKASPPQWVWDRPGVPIGRPSRSARRPLRSARPRRRARFDIAERGSLHDPHRAGLGRASKWLARQASRRRARCDPNTSSRCSAAACSWPGNRGEPAHGQRHPTRRRTRARPEHHGFPAAAFPNRRSSEACLNREAPVALDSLAEGRVASSHQHYIPARMARDRIHSRLEEPRATVNRASSTDQFSWHTATQPASHRHLSNQGTR